MELFPVSASAAEVRPWKLFSAATMTGRPAPWRRRTTLTAASLASVPEFAKKTRPSAGPPALPSRPSSRSASATSPSCRNRLDVCAMLFTWRVTASVTAGCACPSALTAMPAIRSVYSRPSASQTRQPWPRTRATGGTA